MKIELGIHPINNCAKFQHDKCVVIPISGNGHLFKASQYKMIIYRSTSYTSINCHHSLRLHQEPQYK